MKTILLAIALVLSVNLASSSLLSTVANTNSQTDTINWTEQRTPHIHSFVRPDPSEYEKVIDEKGTVMRAHILLSDSLAVDLYEKPKEFGFYNSTVEVKRQGQTARAYNVGELIKHQALSLGHLALIPTSNGSGMLICEYEGGAVGAREGFAILRFSPSGFELHTLPLTDFGKVVLFKTKPEKAEIWTALSDYVGSDAEPRNYATRMCFWRTKGYMCGAPKRLPKRFAPQDINDPGIEIKP